eukprot:GFKZ01014936.1.p1 GENE.GFKZ01014936.1~~GFKZ01014936.1.p1  ORF type:complete len:1621 (+),score=250.80 GFKZ01014936.1:539-4864(+)
MHGIPPPPPHLQQPTQRPQPQQPQQLPQRPRGPVTQQPPQHYLHQFPGAGMPYPGQVPQYPMGGNYVYASPPHYYGLPQHTTQQAVPQNQRDQRPSFVQSMRPPAQNQPSSRVSVPVPQKRILAIVDPDTNEEVKVDKVSTKAASKSAQPPQTSPSPAVKIPERRSRPLELVSDPADSDSKSENTKQERKDVAAKSTPAAPRHDAKVISDNKQKSPATVPDTETESSTTAPEVGLPPNAKSTSSRDGTSSGDGKNVETVTKHGKTVPMENVQAANLSTESRQSPSTSPKSDPTTAVPEINKDNDGVKGTVNGNDSMTSAGADSVSTGVDFSGPDIVETSKNLGASPTHSTSPPKETTQPAMEVEKANGVDGASVRASPVDSDVSQSPASRALAKESGKISASDLKGSSPNVANTAETEEQADVRRAQFIFKDGERRVYAPQFILSMQPASSPQKEEEFLAILVAQSICKGGQSTSIPPSAGDHRRSVPTRNQPNPLSGDPRGKRSFPQQSGPGFMGGMRPPSGSGIVGSGVGSYNAFDLRNARSQNPPPAPRQSNVMRDPRGSRQTGPRDRFAGPIRQGHGQIHDPFINQVPVEKLKRTENGWKRARESDDEVQAKVKQIRSLLNKLTLEKFDKIFKQIIEINISSYEILKEVVKEVFEKALFEPKFSGMYADLCGRLDVATRDMLQKAKIFDDHGKAVFFRNILLNNCKDEFTRFAEESNGVVRPSESGGKTSQKDKPASKKTEAPLTAEQQKLEAAREKEERDLIATKAKRRMLANVRFISELYLKGLLRENIIHKQCIQKLLSIGIEKKEEDVFEALCKLISKTGAKLSENADALGTINTYFQALATISKDHTLPARVRFMLQDLIDQRANGWKLRREEAGAKTIAEIHKDIENEERAKQEAQAANRDRRNRGSSGGGMHHRERGPQNYPPRFSSMTMASRQKPASTTLTRSTVALEKHASRAPPNPGSTLPSLRLGPGGARSSSLSAGSNAPSLRPRGTNYFTPFMTPTEPRDGSASAQSGDLRRPGTKRIATGPRRPISSAKRDSPVEKDGKMELPKLVNVTKRILEEYWSDVKGIKETRQDIESDILPINYPRFIEEAIKASVDAKMDQREKSVSLFCGIIGTPIPPSLSISAFCSIIGLLSDLEMDNPRASEVIAKYIGALAGSGKFTGDQQTPTFGLDFVKTAIVNMGDHKKAARLVVQVLSQLYKNLTASIPDELARQTAVKGALELLDIDLASMMNMWNPMKGSLNLRDMLKDYGVLFVLPTLPVELRLKEVLSSKPTGEDVQKVLSESTLSSKDVRGAGFTKMVIRVTFDWLFMDPPDSIKTTFSKVVGAELVKCLGEPVPLNVQMAALMAAQSFIVSNLNILPPHKEGDSDKPGYFAFESLYESDLVEEDTFMKWKEDTTWSTRVGGKDKMIMQTTKFFQWLETAEEED